MRFKEKRQNQDNRDYMISRIYETSTSDCPPGHRNVGKNLQHSEVLAHIQRFVGNSTSVISTEVEIYASSGVDLIVRREVSNLTSVL
jgi:hypothetical protein